VNGRCLYPCPVGLLPSSPARRVAVIVAAGVVVGLVIGWRLGR
jgi:hypothetical protein